MPTIKFQALKPRRMHDDGHPMNPKGDVPAVRAICNRWTAQWMASKARNPDEALKLIAVDLSGIEFVPNGAKEICKYLLNHVFTVKQAVLCNVISRNPDSQEACDVLEHFVQLFSMAPDLTHLDISKNCLGEHAMDIMKPLLEKKTVTHLFLNNTGLSCQSMLDLLELLKQSDPSRLQVLEVSDNHLLEIGAEAFGSLLHLCTSLQELRYAHNSPRTMGIAKIIVNLMALTKPHSNDGNKNLTKLQLEGSIHGKTDNPDECGAFRLLAQVIKSLPKLECLAVDGAGIGQGNLPILVSGLCDTDNKPPLMELSLAGNTITQEAIPILEQVLIRFRGSLQRLDLSENGGLGCQGIGCQGIHALMNCIPEHNIIKRLGLSKCNIGNAGARYLGAAAETGKLSQLQVLHLDKNEIGDEGARHLQAALQSGKLLNLGQLHLNFNKISKETVRTLQENFYGHQLDLQMENNDDEESHGPDDSDSEIEDEACGDY